MRLTSGAFWLFFAVLLLLYYGLPKRWQKGVLLAASLLFYACSGWGNLLLILAMALYAYLGAHFLDRYAQRSASVRATLDADAKKQHKKQSQRRAKVLMWGVILPELACLALFKYTPAVLGRDLIFPMGLSFFTFQILSYVLDVYRGTLVAERSPFRFLLFACYFPQMVQGPISRYGELTPTLFSAVAWDRERVLAGAFRALLGLAKKLIVADTVLIAVRAVQHEPDAYRGAGVAFLILIYSVQIYADFTGGMDIALGCSEMLGIRLCENFDHPFSSVSIKEYWRRWHISMGRWFTDYVFYPLSVSAPCRALSRHSRRVLGEGLGKRIPVWTATMLTWLLTGVWHGAGWNFVLWGALNGAAILVAQEMQPLWRKMNARSPRYTSSRLHHALCCVGVFSLMGLFRSLDVYGDVSLTLRLWTSLLDIRAWAAVGESFFWSSFGLTLGEWTVVAMGVIFMYLLGKLTQSDAAGIPSKWGTKNSPAWGEALRARLCRRPMWLAVVMALMLAAVLIFGRYGYGYDATQFIYNQF